MNKKMNVFDNKMFFESLEKNFNVVEIFRYAGTNAWPYIKNRISFSLIDKNIRLETGNKKNFMTQFSVWTISHSLKSYVQLLLNRKKKFLFLGASTGLFTLNGKVYDSYFPYADTEPNDVIYMFNCGNLAQLSVYKGYLAEHNIVIENYLCAPLRMVLGKIVFICLSGSQRFQKFSQYASSYNQEITEKIISEAYANFVVGFHVYKIFFKLLKIKSAYIVSAYTKADIVAALKHNGINVIEIQHGLIGRYHPGYNYSVKDCTLPTPDQVDVYNRFWKEDLIAGGYFSDAQIRVVGRLKYNLLTDFSKPFDNYMVFTGQAAFFDSIINFFYESNRALAEKNIYLLYKPHPKETLEELLWLKKQTAQLPNIVIYQGSETTEQLISQAMAHISLFSACHFDAIHFLGKTFVLDIVENNFMSSYANDFKKEIVPITHIDQVIANLLEI